MGFRFHRSISILPGLRANLSRSGASVSVGRRGATVTTGRRGTFASIGIPGSGLSYRQRLGRAPAVTARSALLSVFLVAAGLWAIGFLDHLLFH